METYQLVSLYLFSSFTWMQQKKLPLFRYEVSQVSKGNFYLHSFHMQCVHSVSMTEWTEMQAWRNRGTHTYLRLVAFSHILLLVLVGSCLWCHQVVHEYSLTLLTQALPQRWHVNSAKVGIWKASPGSKALGKTRHLCVASLTHDPHGVMQNKGWKG